MGKSVVNQWANVSYGGSYSNPPVVLSQVQTSNDPTWVKTRHRNVGTTSLQLALEKNEASAVSHGTETVGWIAIDTGGGTVNDSAYVAGRTPNAVTDAWYTLTFVVSVDSPLLFAAMSTYDGPDNAALRYTDNSLTANSMQVRVEEDTTLDAETAHTSEVVDFLVLSVDGLSSTPPP